MGMDEPRATATDWLNGEIFALMGRRRMSQDALGEVIGLSQGQVSQRLNGNVSWRVDELEQVAAYFDVPITDLFPPSGQENSSSRCTEPVELLAA